MLGLQQACPLGLPDTDPATWWVCLLVPDAFCIPARNMLGNEQVHLRVVGLITCPPSDC